MSARVAIVTGAGSGMGQLYVLRMLEEGWSVAALDVDARGLDALGERGVLLKLAVDVRDRAALESAVERAEQELGPVTRVVNCAAIMPLGSLAEMEAAAIHRLFEINVGGLVNLGSATIPRLLARGAGEFISFASLAGLVPIFYMGAYGATKAAVVAYTETLHQETRGRGLRVVCVCPPAVSTPLLRQGHATRWPRFLDLLPPITATQVIDAVERAVSRNRFWVFPGWYTRPSVLARRLLPGLLWWFVRSVERPAELRSEA